MSSLALSHGQFMAMGTRMDMVLADVDAATGRYVQGEMAATVEALEDSLSTYRSDSALSRMNRDLANNVEVVVDDSMLFEALCCADDLFRLTHGHFDVGLGGLTEVYKKQRECSAEERVGLGQLSGMRHVVLDRERQRLSLAQPGLQFDFGGLGKGLALDKCRLVLERCAIENGLLSFGDSAILALGSHPHGDHWPIGLPHPLKKGALVKTIALQNQSLAISSNIKNQEDGGAQAAAPINPHIVNPFTGLPVTCFKTTAVITDTAVSGEALSTALLVADADKQADVVDTDVNYRAFIFNFDVQGCYDECSIGAL